MTVTDAHIVSLVLRERKGSQTLVFQKEVPAALGSQGFLVRAVPTFEILGIFTGHVRIKDTHVFPNVSHRYTGECWKELPRTWKNFISLVP